MSTFIPYGRQSIDEEDIQNVVSVLSGDWLTTGPAVQQFEKALAGVTGSKHAFSCSNGTTALHLAVSALGIKPGDVVLVPGITFLSTANSVRFEGADVRFVDVDPKTALVTPELLEKSIQQCVDKTKIKAFINVHFAGQCGDLEEIEKVARKYELKIIEDAAHAIGSTYIAKNGDEFPVGTCQYCDLTTFSFHPVKTIAAGEGGAVTTNDASYAKRLSLMRGHGMTRNESDWGAQHQNEERGPWFYEMQNLGFNYRISDINCALACSQLKKLSAYKSQRQDIVAKYDSAFSGKSFLQPLVKTAHSNPAWHLYVLLIDFEALGKTRTQVMTELKERGIGTQVHYIPVYKQPYYRELYGDIHLEGAEAFYSQCLSIPLYVGLSSENTDYVIESILDLCA
ncbi:MAG: UDP-4-amino-4,6-dideoxy-N-acetyl-beta-L-altrosamine transaminase [Alphaproteobacteria bacterium]|jgi:UDP-4-amino-4,6-dideoxy-N-acetyl-beta-L-altrosamine transaminase|nr:UDP-4-amino-4,6-dideoxy-N-acetyl-beta-L-altrosamine transaminase [Alphaproteobacteria bacterium]MBT5389766.1 UDP-4-amino-4,6-dideoxy-N-acetyl-beta-L-altrosamine transaminase [Alphaproteobacteria bacterium]MBT5540860.1 UDP-4-amino-4,6-dideoxy-N-acetyl-beta-L-altrosamine transaminase [Alphaproteobacteria bacterium]